MKNYLSKACNLIIYIRSLTFTFSHFSFNFLNFKFMKKLFLQLLKYCLCLLYFKTLMFIFNTFLMDDLFLYWQKFGILVRDIYAFYPLLIKYVDLHRSHWLKNPAAEAEELFSCVADIFTMWTKSLVSKRSFKVLYWCVYCYGWHLYHVD